jgi:hypothetical protein
MTIGLPVLGFLSQKGEPIIAGLPQRFIDRLKARKAAGVPWEKGDDHGGLQPPTLMFCLAGVDSGKLRMSICEEPRTYLTDFIPNEYFGQNRRFIVVGLRSQSRRRSRRGCQFRRSGPF